jgi:RNA polymerase sigma factor (sigma-70 family)
VEVVVHADGGEQTLTGPALGAFRDFYEAELPGQVRRAALMVGSDELGNDVVHDAMVEVFRRWDHLEHPGAYLNRAVLNGCRDVARRAATQRRSLHRLIDRAPAPQGDDRVDDLLAVLPFHQRAVVVLRFYCGMSTAEIAVVLHCAEGTVGSSLHRALARLRRELP